MSGGRLFKRLPTECWCGSLPVCSPHKLSAAIEVARFATDQATSSDLSPRTMTAAGPAAPAFGALRVGFIHEFLCDGS